MQDSQDKVPRWMIVSIAAAVVLVLFALAGRDVDRTTAMAPDTAIVSR
jgi:hypothetical protein